MRLSALGAELVPQRIRLICPKCGQHVLTFSFGHGWSVTSGSTIEDVTIRPSFHLLTGCKAHFTVTNGTVEVSA